MQAHIVEHPPSGHRKAPNAIERLIQKGGKNSAVKTTKKKNKQVKEAKANGKNNIVCAMNNANPTRKQFFGLLLLHSRSARFVIRRGKKLSATEKQFISTLRLNVCVCVFVHVHRPCGMSVGIWCISIFWSALKHFVAIRYTGSELTEIVIITHTLNQAEKKLRTVNNRKRKKMQ